MSPGFKVFPVFVTTTPSNPVAAVLARWRLPRRCRISLPVLGASLLLPLLLGACATGGPPRNPDDICAVFHEKRSWHRAARKAEDKWGAPMHVPLAILGQESGFRRKARPPRKRLLGFIPWRRPSSAFGFAQAVNGTWRDYVTARREPWRERDNFADAIDFVYWYNAEAMRRNGVSQADAYNLYLNYHEGTAGYASGSHLHKNWLVKVAQGVQMQSQRYATQYTGCRDALERGFFRRLLGW